MNGLNPTERELLTMLAEEAGEVVQAVTKILRHGPDSYNPDAYNRVLNTSALRKEIIDMVAVVRLMSESYESPVLQSIAAVPSDTQISEAMRRKTCWMHNPPSAYRTDKP